MPTTNVHYHSGEPVNVTVQTVPNAQSVAVCFGDVRVWFATKAQLCEALRDAHLELLQLELADQIAEARS